VKQRITSACFFLILLALVGASYGQSPAGPLVDEIIRLPDGRTIDKIIVPGHLPPAIKMATTDVPPPNKTAGINVLSDVPAFDWSYGCSATSAAMLAGYYDNTGYPDMYTGPANSGVCPMDNSIWGSGECPLSATHQGYDGRTTKGHVDDYWDYSGSPNPDPYIENWAEHTYGDCTGDFMKTNQSAYGNKDGSTTFLNWNNGTPFSETAYPQDGGYGLELFLESRGYVVSERYNQYVEEQVLTGFSFEQFQQEIDAGRPVLIHTRNNSGDGHTMLAYGYNTSGSVIYIHDTWDHLDHQMAWDGTYSYLGLFIYAVTVIQLEDNDIVFEDDFKSGNTTAWSNTVQ
jgi:hypothetical protein